MQFSIISHFIALLSIAVICMSLANNYGYFFNLEPLFYHDMDISDQINLALPSVGLILIISLITLGHIAPLVIFGWGMPSLIGKEILYVKTKKHLNIIRSVLVTMMILAPLTATPSSYAAYINDFIPYEVLVVYGVVFFGFWIVYISPYEKKHKVITYTSLVFAILLTNSFIAGATKFYLDSSGNHLYQITISDHTTCAKVFRLTSRGIIASIDKKPAYIARQELQLIKTGCS